MGNDKLLSSKDIFINKMIGSIYYNLKTISYEIGDNVFMLELEYSAIDSYNKDLLHELSDDLTAKLDQLIISHRTNLSRQVSSLVHEYIEDVEKV